MASQQGLIQKEAIAQKARILADGGTIINWWYMNKVIETYKMLGIYGNCKLLLDANFAVKKDSSGLVSKLYDISGNNNDATQITGSRQPIWTLVNGKGTIAYDGIDDTLRCGNPANLNITGALTMLAKYDMSTLVLPLNNRMQLSGGMLSYLGVYGGSTIPRISLSIGGVQNVLLSNLVTIIDTPYNIIGTWNEDKINIYANAVLKNTSPSYIGAISFDKEKYIGSWGGRTDGYFHSGKINTAAIFNIALTQTQITVLNSIIL